MAFLDVSDLTLDPDFASSFTVQRRSQIINDSGVVSMAVRSLPAIGVVMSPTSKDLIRGDAAQLLGKLITVDTTFALQGPAPGFQPDLVVWHGDSYVVVQLDDYSNFGMGFVHALCQSIDITSQPPQPTPPQLP